jgi:hypothetical protein
MFEDTPLKNIKVTKAKLSKTQAKLAIWPWRSMSFINKSQVLSSLIEVLVQRVVVAKYEDNTQRTLKVEVCGRQRERRHDCTITFTFFFEKK